MPDNARPHVLQRHALHHLHERLAAGGRGVVVMPCGSGKTLLGRWFAEQTAARTTVVFVPSLALVPQTVAAYRAGATWQHRTMIVCSDPTSGRAVALDDLDLPAWARTSVTASTSSRVVEEFLTGGGPARLIVSTYHSAPRVAAALQQSGVIADLVVCDEAHRLTGRPRREFRAVLDDDALPALRRVFLTATPVEAAAWAAESDTDGVAAPIALDDEDLFGPTVYRATFADAVAAGRLVDYDVEVLAVRPDVDEQPDRDAGSTAAVLAAVRDGATRILTFHSRVSHARALAHALDGHQLPDSSTVRAEHLESRHRAHRRAAALGRLANPAAGEVAVLASARILTEGVDVPAVDTVVFAEPRTSPVDIVQAVGRAMRLAPGKTRGRVVLAVTSRASGGMDEDTELASTAWRHVWTVLRALASMDPRFAGRLRGFASGNHGGQRGTGGGPGLTVNLPDGLDIDRWVLRALDRTGGSWWHRYDLLKAHAAQFGAARPASATHRDGVPIGSWVAHQRTLHRQGVLEQDRVAALEQLPGWAWTPRDAAWWQAAGVWERRHSGRTVTGFERWAWLAEIPAWTGGKAPARKFDHLADFAIDTCARRRRGELPVHLLAAADRLPGWQWGIVDGDDARMVDALAEYGAWKKDLNPPHDYRHDDGLPLGAWLTAVRRRHFTGRLALPLELELTALARHDRAGLRWETAETSWRVSYVALRQFVDREHTTRIPTDHEEALPDCAPNISRWCVVQRLERRHGRLSADRVRALEQISGWQWEIPVRRDASDRVILDDVEHGHRWAYARGCRCDFCSDANSAEARRLVAEGTDLVDARPAREHLRRLLARGAGQKPLARAAGINVKSVVAIAGGEVSRIRPERAELILALTFDAAVEHIGDGRWGELVPAGPTWKLIDWMVMRGWPKAWIGREIGQDGRALQLKRDRITQTNADKVTELDRRLGRTRRPPARRGGPLPTLAELLRAEEVSA